MKQESTAGSCLSSSRRCSWYHRDGNFPILLVTFVVFCLSFCSWFLPCTVNGSLDSCGPLASCDGCAPAPYTDSTASGFGWGSSGGFPGLTNVCTDSGSFCFPSMLMGFLAEEEDSGRMSSLEAFQGLIHREGIGSSWHQGNAAFQMSNGGIVSCHMKDTASGIHDKWHSENKYDEAGVASCHDPLVSDFWMRASNELSDEHSEEIETGVLSGSSSPNVEINPPVLDWGGNTLYSPSLKFLNVANAYNNSILLVYGLFSTDLQFYAYDFDKITLEPGESASFTFVFLPRWLGLSSAHLVMQTNFGGFIINAKGVGIESPYRIEPSVGLDVSSYGSLSRIFSLYNPSDNVLYVEEVTMRISISSQNINHSAHIVCSINASHPSSDEFSSSLTDKEWLTVMSGELGMSWVDIRPHKKWEVPPHNAEAIIEMNLWPRFDGEVFGVICVQLRNSTQVRADTVIVPVEVEVHGRKAYHDLTGSLSVFLEPLVPCAGRGSIFSLSVRNDASYIVSVGNIIEATEGSKLFQVNYMEGLILYPKTVTQIALISYTLPVDDHSTPSEVPSVSFNCELFIVTNHSASPEIKIPCQDLVHTCSRYKPVSSFAAPEGSIGEKEKSINSRSGSLGSIIEEPLPIKPKLIEVVEADESILRNWRTQGTMSEMSVLDDREVLFPVVQIGTNFSKWITVRNPSHKPVIMQLVLNSGAIVDQCKSNDHLSEFTLLSRFGHVDSRIIQDGFSIADSAITEAFVHPLSSASFGPVVFRPSKRCMWRTSALIRNNLSGVEWLPLRAFGGSHSLVLLEGSEPVRKLEFNLSHSIRANRSSWDMLSHKENSSASCDRRLSKELYAKNTGELPLEVLKLDISGTNCGLGGFMIHNLKDFALAPGDSIKVLISYQADFSAAVVHRDLELAMATGIFVIPMKAILPVHLLNLCRKSSLRSVLWSLSVLLLVAVSIAFIVFVCIIPQAFSSNTEYDFVKNGKTITTISGAGKPYQLHHNTKRSIGENEKPEVGYAGRYSKRSNGVRYSDEGMQDKKKTTSSLSSSTTKSAAVLDSSDLSEARNNADLTVHLVRERGRRRKRRATGATLPAKFEVSSSQSGNSTPSSPVSPNATTAKQIWPLSSGTAENQYSQVSEQNPQKRHDTEVSVEARAPETKKHTTDTWLLSAQDQPQVTVKSAGKPTLSFSATFPGPGCRAPGLGASNFLASTSPIAPHARAPGSKLAKDKTIKREESDVLVKEFIYDIWGNNFSDHFLGRPKEVTSKKVFDASEGDSQSFFAREPQSLMTMSSARSVSPGHELPSYNVKHLYQMD